MITCDYSSKVTVYGSEKKTVSEMSFKGLSGDTKPTGTFEGTEIRNGSSFYEMDAKKVFLYDEENRRWLEQ